MTTETAAIQVIGPTAGETVNVLGAPISIKSDGRADQLFFAEQAMPPGYGVPMHVHADEDELFYVLSGELTLETEAGELVAKAGSFVHLPQGVPHGFHNATGDVVRALVVATPGGALEGVFRGLDALGAAGEVTPEAIAAVTRANRVKMLFDQAA
jgi:quercetin dioxygenase-like cupin family protein